jgi:starch synthase
VELLKAFGLPVPDERTPLFGMVSRIIPQKGIDILLAALSQLLQEKIEVVILGSGDPAFEQSLQKLAKRFPDKVSVKIGFEPKLAHWVEAGSDFFLMPSRYEPCGLNQMYSLRYGTVPIVRATGGLDDTVRDASQPNGTGFKFQEYSVQGLAGAIRRALALYQSPARLRALRVRGMKEDFSWRVSARKYQTLYRSLVSSQQPLSQARNRASG